MYSTGAKQPKKFSDVILKPNYALCSEILQRYICCTSCSKALSALLHEVIHAFLSDLTSPSDEQSHTQIQNHCR